MPSVAVKQSVWSHLGSLVKQWERLSAERDFLMNGVAARLAEVNGERTALLAEAQTALTRLNELRVADGQPELTLQQVRTMLTARGPGSRGVQQ